MILKSEAVPFLAEKAVTHYGSETAVYANVRGDQFIEMIAASGRGDEVGSQINYDDKHNTFDIKSEDKVEEKNIERYICTNLIV